MGQSNAVSDSLKPNVKESDTKDGQKLDIPPAPLLSLFTGADTRDAIAIGLGVAGALVNGASFPAFAFVFGEVMSFSTCSTVCSVLAAERWCTRPCLFSRSLTH